MCVCVTLTMILPTIDMKLFGTVGPIGSGPTWYFCKHVCTARAVTSQGSLAIQAAKTRENGDLLKYSWILKGKNGT